MKIVLGTVQFGLHYGINNQSGKPDIDQVFAMLDYAFKNNVASLDTADAYGDAESIIGNYNKSIGGKFSINTKFKIKEEPIGFQLASSLQRLNAGSIDTYFYHSYADFISVPAILDELIKIKSENRIRNIGVSVYTNEQLNEVARYNDVDVIQLPFNMLDNRSKRYEHILRAKGMGKKIQVRSVFLQGLFFKPLSTLSHKLLPLQKYLNQLHKLSEDTQIGVEQLALQYVASQSAIDEMVIGVDNIEQLKRNLLYANESLDESIIMRIEKIDVTEEELLLPVNWS